MLVQLGTNLIDNKQCNINKTLWLSYNHFWCILFVYNLIVHDIDYNSRMNQPISFRPMVSWWHPQSQWSSPNYSLSIISFYTWMCHKMHTNVNQLATKN